MAGRIFGLPTARLLIFHAADRAVCDVFVDGQNVVADRHVLTLDEAGAATANGTPPLAIEMRGNTLLVHASSSSWGGYPGQDAGPVEIDIGKLEPGQKINVEWRGKVVWIINRTPAMLSSLQANFIKRVLTSQAQIQLLAPDQVAGDLLADDPGGRGGPPRSARREPPFHPEALRAIHPG